MFVKKIEKQQNKKIIDKCSKITFKDKYLFFTNEIVH
jgi:hypothetical protein